MESHLQDVYLTLVQKVLHDQAKEHLSTFFSDRTIGHPTWDQAMRLAATAFYTIIAFIYVGSSRFAIEKGNEPMGKQS